MPRVFAIDWDRYEVRGLLVHSGPTGTSVAGAWAVPFELSEGAAPSARQVGAALATAMGQRMVGKATTIIGVGRDNVQMKLLTLPPAPADELPDMVRFQAEREFTTLGSDAALDFIPLAGDAQTQHQVLAVALSPAGMAEAREVCELLDVPADRVVLRACAAASLVHRAGIAATESVVLVVNPLADEADLIAVADGLVLLMRTVRLPEPAQSEARERTLMAEIRRTVAAIRQQLGERQVDRVLVCGNAETGDQVSGLADELDLGVTMFDPASHAPAGLANQGLPTGSVSRFAAVLGMALTEADRRPPIIDFVNVRKRAEARRFGRLHALAAAAAVVAALGIGFHMWRETTAQARELAQIQAEIKDLEPSVKQAKQLIDQATAVERWLAKDVAWLDELDQLSQRVRPKTLSESDFPVAEDVVVSQITFSRPRSDDPAAGQIDVRAVAKSSDAMPALEKRLDDDQHDVTTEPGKRDLTTVPGYDWGFRFNVSVLPPPDGEEARP